MLEIQVFQALIALLLFLYAIKPMVKLFQEIPGISILPLLALGITILAFLVAGFQPQIIPLGLLAFFFSLGSLPAIMRQASHLDTNDWMEMHPLRILFRLLLLGLLTSFSFLEAPREAPVIEGFSRAPWACDARIPGRSQPIPVRLYPPPSSSTGKEDVLLLIAPPAQGSAAAVDRTARELAARGYWTLSYASPRTDFPATAPSPDASVPRRSWPAPVTSVRMALASLSHPASLRAVRIRTRLAHERTETAMALYAWLVEQARSGWPAIAGGPSNFAPTRLVASGFSDGAEAALSLAQRYGSPWTEEEDAPPLPVSALLLTEPLFAGEWRGNSEPDGSSPDGRHNLLSRFFRGIGGTVWRATGFKRASGIAPQEKETPRWNVHIPLLLVTSSGVANSAERALRYRPALSLLASHQAPGMLFAVSDSRPSDYTSLAYDTPLSAKALDRGLEAASSYDAVISSTRATASFLDLVLYGTEAKAEPWQAHHREFNNYWYYPGPPAIMGEP